MTGARDEGFIRKDRFFEYNVQSPEVVPTALNDFGDEDGKVCWILWLTPRRFREPDLLLFERVESVVIFLKISRYEELL